MSPVIPGYEEYETVLAKDQPEYMPLPVLVLDGGGVPLVCRWRLDEPEREAIAKGADSLITTLTFGQPFQPVRLELSMPDEVPLSIWKVADL